MDAFLTLAGEQFLILCMQSALETMLSKRQNPALQKSIELGCYLASLLLVLRFMEEYIFDIFRSIANFL